MWLKEHFLIFTQQIGYLSDDSLIILILLCICCLMSQSLPPVLRVDSYHSTIVSSFPLEHGTMSTQFPVSFTLTSCLHSKSFFPYHLTRCLFYWISPILSLSTFGKIAIIIALHHLDLSIISQKNFLIS